MPAEAEAFALEVQGLPPVASAGRTPRPYQLAMIEAWRAGRDSADGHMGVSFCGSGKTFVAGTIAGMEQGRVLFLVNRSKLASQSIKKLAEDSGRRWQLEQAGEWATVNGEACIVATVQSLRDKRLERFAPDAFSLIIADEVHMMMGKTYRRALEYFTGAKRLGLTATPDRKPKKRKDGSEGPALGYRGMFDNVLWRYDLAWAIENAWSTPLDQRVYESEIDLDSVKRVNGDFAAGELDDELVKAAAIIRTACFEKCGDLRTVVFCPGVKSAIAVCDALNAERPGCARVIYGDQDAREGAGTKERNMAAHARGEFQYLVNCMILTVGYDDEKLQCIVDASPTSSRALAEQKFGRPARLWPGLGDLHDLDERRRAIAGSPKPMARIVDLAFNSRHPLSTPLDVLGGHYTAKEKERAKKIIERDGVSVSQALAAAKAEIEERAARAKRQKAVNAKLKEVKIGAPPPPVNHLGQPLASEKSRARLRDFGIPFAADITQARASEIMKTEYGRLKFSGHSNEVQLAWLRDKAGVDCKTCSIARGKLVKAAYLANGRQPLTAEEILKTTRTWSK